MRQFAPFLLLAAFGGCVTSAHCDGVASRDGNICTHIRDTVITHQRIVTLTEQAARERKALIDYLGNDVGPITMIVREKGIAHHRPPASIYMPNRLIAKNYRNGVRS